MIISQIHKALRIIYHIQRICTYNMKHLHKKKRGIRSDHHIDIILVNEMTTIRIAPESKKKNTHLHSSP